MLPLTCSLISIFHPEKYDPPELCKSEKKMVSGGPVTVLITEIVKLPKQILNKLLNVRFCMCASKKLALKWCYSAVAR